MAHSGQRHVRQSKLDELTFARQASVPLGGEQADGNLLTSQYIPGGKGIVYRLIICSSAGEIGEPDPAVDGVVQRIATVTISGEIQKDQIVSLSS